VNCSNARRGDDIQQSSIQPPSLNAPDVQRVAQEHLHPDEMIVVAVGDAAKIENDSSQIECHSSERRGRGTE